MEMLLKYSSLRHDKARSDQELVDALEELRKAKNKLNSARLTDDLRHNYLYHILY